MFLDIMNLVNELGEEAVKVVVQDDKEYHLISEKDFYNLKKVEIEDEIEVFKEEFKTSQNFLKEIELNDWKICYMKSTGYNGNDSAIAQGTPILRLQATAEINNDTYTNINVFYSLKALNEKTKKQNTPKEILFFYQEIS